VYGLETWVRTHATCVLCEGHSMIRMLLTGCMVRICQYWTWPRGNVLGLGLTDEDVGLLRGLDCDILV
jgi:hypothetical protein